MGSLDGVSMEIGDETTGVTIMRRALEMPMRKIAANAGEDGAVIIQNVRRAQEDDGNHRVGFNVMNGEYGDMIDAGIPDPAKVTRGAIENSASIAAMILTTEALDHGCAGKRRPRRCPVAAWTVWVAWAA